ncbi:MAG: hypothetical protein FJZ88_10675, partial [Chloroflexi bacterium]|nr:hypothetical protein [Chloroflexota bacterium]
MTFLDAAHEILKQAGQPLHYREIARRAYEQGLIKSTGKTPEVTMNAQLAVNTKRAEEGGPPSRFVRAGRSVFGLRGWGEAMSTIPTTDKEPQPSYLSYKEAALRVLRDAGQSLNAQEITTRAIKQELINPQGLTPDATMGAQLYTDVNRQGVASLFRKEGRNLFGLAEWEKGVSGIARLAVRQQQEVKGTLHERLLTMPPAEFEQLIGRLLVAMGYENVTVTRRSG